ncbi:hypothetical protein BASA50_004761 [Batrachochytrium salamandrivorans]|uniref:Uncharacterized protein n=1 Tax=Batrachochytrium salamandrivorans TaxID=1357716 RepID=A0ABQ8FEN6_9FUNG|nr:hypothetical protein BASA60_008928 [Batrachochytrium salamandrivorans]KAH6597003.1 hypothetical protein BASA50_004761 [Batrachochytrium salamandrivorans]
MDKTDGTQCQQQPIPTHTACTVKKERPPKPGSKKAQLLKPHKRPSQLLSNALEEYIPPAYVVHEQVLVLIFANPMSLKTALDRPHIAYEGGHLNGPLRGVNFSADFLLRWGQLAVDQSGPEAGILALIHSPALPTSIPPPLASSTTTTPSSSTSIPSSTHADTIPPCTATPRSNPNTQTAGSAHIVYVIAGIKGDRSTFLHEWAHARYFLDTLYRAEATRIWESLDTVVRRSIEKDLLMRQYQPTVLIDEFQAYLVETPADFGKRWAGVLNPHHVKLRALVKAPVGLW